jgi:anaphase-promoting complex subunit 4
VAQSTGIILLVNSHTGKVVHQVDCERHSKAQICALGWGVNFVEVAAARTRINEIGKDVTLDDVLSRGLKALDSDAPLDLPADLAFLDAESVLPKLSVLPAVGKEDDVFASRASLDAMFHPSKKDGNDTVDVLVVAFEDGSVHLSIYDFFEIGGFVAPCGGPNLRIVHHCSHPYSSTHGLVVADNEEAPKSLEFAPLDLRLIPDTGRYLSLLASKATQLQNLIRYIREAQTQIHSEFKSSQDLPSRFIRNIDETLQEKESTSFTNAAYHVVATGDCSPSMKEWLVDELGERGQKRWDKAATSGYENLIRFTFENLLPALDRFGVLISRLRGLSRFQGLTSEFGLDTVELEQVLDTLSCLQIHSHTVLQKAGAELRQYTNFSKWMKLEIELQAAEPGSQTAEDVAAKYATLEHPAIFQYIQGALQKSELYELLNVQPADDERPLWEMPPDNSNMYEVFKKALKSSQQGHRDKKLPGLSILLSRLENQCKLVFNRISQTQKRKVSFGKPIPVFNGEVRCFDAKAVIDETDDAELCRYYVAVASKESEIELTKITLRVTNGVSSTESVERAAFVLKRGSMIKDLKFADDSTLMVAQKIEGR